MALATWLKFDWNAYVSAPRRMLDMMSELDRQIIHDWLSMLIHQKNDDVAMNDMGIIKACAKAHYQAVHMEEKIRDLRGNLPGFLDFLRSKWGWIVEHDESARTVVADENKPGCVCPLNAEGLMNSPMLCECSCGFAEQMFEYVVGKKVKASVVESVLRGGTHCVYKICY